MDAEALAAIRGRLDNPDSARHADALSEATHWAVLTWGQHRRRTSRVRLLAVLEAAAGAMAWAGLALQEEDGREGG